VVGKTAYLAAAAILALGAIGWAIRDSYLAFVIACFILVLAGGALWRIFKYAEEHPESSLLEGAELIQWKQLEMAAKGLLHPPIGENIEPPKVIPPPQGGE